MLLFGAYAPPHRNTHKALDYVKRINRAYQNTGKYSNVDLWAKMQKQAIMKRIHQKRRQDTYFGLRGFEDKYLICKDCGSTFLFSAHAQAYFKKKGFNIDEWCRCTDCRRARKNARRKQQH